MPGNKNARYIWNFECAIASVVTPRISVRAPQIYVNDPDVRGDSCDRLANPDEKDN
jgi:hypothetical protein